jgi:dihydroflavonol-4-reductase
MKILVVGGGGLIGGRAAVRLSELGHEVEIASRNPPGAETPMAAMPFHRIDFVADAPDPALLARFEAIIFAAGNDARHSPKGDQQGDFLLKANGDRVPHFFAAAKAAGVKHAVLIGSFYPQAAPHLVAGNVYVQSRLAADEGVRKLADDDFHVVVLNAPFVIGQVPGLIVPGYRAMARWGLGLMPQLGRFSIAGGVNVISTDTLTDAVIGAIEQGENGKAYLVGDENLTFQDYLGMFWKAAGNDDPLPLEDRDHPLLGPAAILAGRGNTIYYDPDPAEVALLGYRRNDIANAIQVIVDAERKIVEKENSA